MSGRLVSSINNDTDSNDRYIDPSFILGNASSATSIEMELQLLDREEWCLDMIFPFHRSYMISEKK